MKTRPRQMLARLAAMSLALLAAGCGPPRGGQDAAAAEFAARVADRAAIERVYHDNRLGEKPPFERAMPPEALERLVRLDLRKEAALRSAYGVAITPEREDAEVRRIEANTRAPETLAQVKAALGHDPARFARAFARPLAVEAELRARFDNDEALHAPHRRQAEAAREAALAARADGPAAQAAALRRFGETATNNWSLISRPAGEQGSAAPVAHPPATRVTSAGGPYAVEATVRLAQTLDAGPAGAEASRVRYFEDLDPQLRRVLAVQLTAAGEVSAVIDLPAGFLVYVATSVTPETLSAATLSIPKRNYDEWLSQQKE